MKNNRNNKRKMAVAVLAGLALTGIIGASAASLGGIRSDSLGADVSDVASCDTTGVDVSYDASYVYDDDTPDALDAAFATRATITNVNDSCEGLAYEVSLLDVDGAVLAQKVGTVTFVAPTTPVLVNPDDETFVVDFTPVNAELVEGIAIVISG